MHAIVTVQVPQTVIFTRDASQRFLSEASLWFVLPHVTCEQVRRLFGTGFANERKEKYSSKIVIKSSATGNEYTLYMSYGVWRVGALKTSTVDQAALEQLFK